MEQILFTAVTQREKVITLDLMYGRRRRMNNIPLIHKQRLLQKIYRNVKLDKRVLTYEKKPITLKRVDIKV